MSFESWELMRYVVTVAGLPLAIFVSLFEQRKERENEEEVGQLLSGSALNAEQKERSLPTLLHGEDPGFVRYVERLHAQAQPS